MESKDDEIGNICVTLKQGERLQLGEESQLQVLRVGGAGTGKGVRLRITAPKRVKVFRVKERKDAGHST